MYIYVYMYVCIYSHGHCIFLLPVFLPTSTPKAVLRFIASPVLPEQARVEVADCTFDHTFCAWTVQNEDPLATRPSENWRLATRDVGAVAGLRDHTFDADGGGCEGVCLRWCYC